MRDFAVVDAQLYSIELCHDPGKGEESRAEVFPRWHQLPFSKMPTFYRSKPFNLEAKYLQEAAVPHADLQPGRFTVNKVVSAAGGEAFRIKEKLRRNLRDIFSVVSASDRKPDGRQASAGCANDGDLAAAGAATGEEAPPNQGGDPDKVAEDEPVKKENWPSPKDKQAKATELPVEGRVPQLSAFEMDQLVKSEVKMVHTNRIEKERLICQEMGFESDPMDSKRRESLRDILLASNEKLRKVNEEIEPLIDDNDLEEDYNTVAGFEDEVARIISEVREQTTPQPPPSGGDKGSSSYLTGIKLPKLQLLHFQVLQ
ncbi:heat shock 70 kDa protein 4-like [Ixodes scapularis]|uniref:heat shock 70 kDa protein 4-like n=1 Tax=Ixodes scapularis TaxID=6945 RepID=UPI001AD77B98|nr:heat shock 70 kDa protein 4-like [Ixodes scapularis]